MEIKLLKGERALVVDSYLVIADLHLGYEKTIKERGYVIPNQRKDFAERIRKLKTDTNTKKLIIIGDVKHNIPVATINESYELPRFFRELSQMFEEVIIVKGNHDGSIENMIHEENVKIAKEFLLEQYVFIHGHSYPSLKAKSGRIVIMAHVHPTFKIKDMSGTKHNYPCWITGDINSKKIKKYKDVKWEKIIVLPSFNPLTYGSDMLRGPFAKAVTKKSIYLLDLTKVK